MPPNPRCLRSLCLLGKEVDEVNDAVVGGFRIGELLALRWKHMDFKRCVIAVPSTRAGIVSVVGAVVRRSSENILTCRSLQPGY